MLTLSDFFIFWVFIEFFMLILIGVSFTLFSSSYSFLMLYFLIQTLASFRILIFYISSLRLILSFSLLLKLSMFPFHFWFISVSYRFPNFMLWIISSLHKLPIFFIIMFFSIPLDSFLIWVSVILSTLFSGFLILNSSDLRFRLVVSSVGNNSWLLLSSFQRVFIFSVHFLVYAFTLFLIFHYLSYRRKPNLSLSSPLLLGIVLSLSALPPFPLFFTKALIFYSIFSFSFYRVLLTLLILSNVLIVVSYFQVIFKYFIFSFSTPPFPAY